MVLVRRIPRPKVTKEKETGPSGVFIVSSNWRGVLNIGNMRTFDTEADCMAYVIANKWDKQEDYRIYEVFSDKPPRLCSLRRHAKS